MGLLKTAATVAVASSVHGRVQRRQQARWAAQEPAPAAVPPAGPAVQKSDNATVLSGSVNLAQVQRGGRQRGLETPCYGSACASRLCLRMRPASQTAVASNRSMSGVRRPLRRSADCSCSARDRIS